jgi:hypothetical protein
MASHAEFVKISTDRQWVWGVRDYNQAVAAVFGRTGTAVVAGIAVVLLCAPLVFAWIAVQQGRPALIVWSVLAAVSWYTARPNFGFIDIVVRASCLGVAAFLARTGGDLHLVGGGMVVVIFLLAALTKFLVMQRMQSRLRRSAAAFDRLVAADLFLSERRT